MEQDTVRENYIAKINAYRILKDFQPDDSLQHMSTEALRALLSDHKHNFKG